jgi:hypothetical protein
MAGGRYFPYGSPLHLPLLRVPNAWRRLGIVRPVPGLLLGSDGMEDDYAASRNGPNGITLEEGQRLYRRYRTSTLHCLRHVRRPRPDEARDPDWQPVASSPGDDELDFFVSDLGRLLSTLTEEALDAARASRSDSDIARFEGLRAALLLFIRQADDFGVPRAQVGIDPQLRIGEDLNPRSSAWTIRWLRSGATTSGTAALRETRQRPTGRSVTWPCTRGVRAR